MYQNINSYVQNIHLMNQRCARWLHSVFQSYPVTAAFTIQSRLLMKVNCGLQKREATVLMTWILLLF